MPGTVLGFKITTFLHGIIYCKCGRKSQGCSSVDPCHMLWSHHLINEVAEDNGDSTLSKIKATVELVCTSVLASW